MAGDPGDCQTDQGTLVAKCAKKRHRPHALAAAEGRKTAQEWVKVRVAGHQGTGEETT